MTTEKNSTHRYDVAELAAKLGLTPDDAVEYPSTGIEWCTEPAEGAPVFLVEGWTAVDGDAEVAVPGATDGLEAALVCVREGSRAPVSETTWVHISAWQVVVAFDASGNRVEGRANYASHPIVLQPAAPECVGSSTHSWSCHRDVVGGDLGDDPGVYRDSAGVTIRTHCERCGVYCVTRTDALDPLVDRTLSMPLAWRAELEARPGRRRVRYEGADHASLLYARERETHALTRFEALF